MNSATLLCLAMNIYFEARGESLLGQKLVAETTMNRVYDKRWPNDICGVVYDKYQFSWTLKPYPVQDWKSFSTALLIANDAATAPRTCIDHYHNDTVSPTWAKDMKVQHIVGKHIFYCSEK